MIYKKLLTLMSIIGVIILLSVSTSLAGGWHKIGTKEGNTGGIQSPTDPTVSDIGIFDPDAGLFTSESQGVADRVPHLNLPTSSNKCRTCHAVHNADNTATGLSGTGKTMGDSVNTPGTGNNFKLLRNEDRVSECNFCHGPNGALTNPIKKPYAPIISGGQTIQPKGQHTLGAKAIPDSTVDPTSNSIATDGLSCGNCHSVHGGWTLNDLPNSGSLGTRILRRDPANNGNDGDMTNSPSIGDGAAGGVKNVQPQGGSNKPIAAPDADTEVHEKQLLAAFCGDCHNKNVNWSTGGSGVAGQSTSLPGVSEGTRPNRYAHPLGQVDGLIDVYGRLASVEPTAPTPRLSCDNCHASRGQSPSKFPHQSVGHKLFDNAYSDLSSELDPTVDPAKPTNYQAWLKPWDVDGNGNPLTNAYTGDPNRPLPKLDARLCRGCHSFIGQADNPDSF